MIKISAERLKSILAGTAQNLTAKEVWVRNAAMEAVRNNGSLDQFILPDDPKTALDVPAITAVPQTKSNHSQKIQMNQKILMQSINSNGIVESEGFSIKKEVRLKTNSQETDQSYFETAMNSVKKFHRQDVEELVADLKLDFTSANSSNDLPEFFRPEVLHRAIQGHKTINYKPSNPNSYYYHNYGRHKKSGDQWRFERKPKFTHNRDYSNFVNEFKEVDVSLIIQAASLGGRANELFENDVLKTVRGLRSDSERGFIYILSSTETGVSKIGMTKNSAHQRLRDYVSTHQLKGNWIVFAVFPTEFVSKVEREAHDFFSTKRVSTATGARELFQVSPEIAEREIQKILRQYNKDVFIRKVSLVNSKLRSTICERNRVRSELIESLNSQIFEYTRAKNAEAADFLKRREEYEALPLHKKIFFQTPIQKRGEIGASEGSIASKKSYSALGCLLIGGWIPILIAFRLFGATGGCISLVLFLAIVALS